MIDPADTDNPQQWCIYGFLDDLGAIEHRSGALYRHRFSIAEVLP
jgi:hypothetical protein